MEEKTMILEAMKKALQTDCANICITNNNDRVNKRVVAK